MDGGGWDKENNQDKARYTSEEPVTRATVRSRTLMKGGQWPEPHGKHQETAIIRTHEALAERK